MFSEIYPVSWSREPMHEEGHSLRLAENTFGTATQLGGFSRLRSYSQGRYKGAHTLFYGTEIRWNLTDESTPYNIFVMKDVRTAVQVAAFYEIGSTADLRSDSERFDGNPTDRGSESLEHLESSCAAIWPLEKRALNRKYSSDIRGSYKL